MNPICGTALKSRCAHRVLNGESFSRPCVRSYLQRRRHVQHGAPRCSAAPDGIGRSALVTGKHCIHLSTQPCSSQDAVDVLKTCLTAILHTYAGANTGIGFETAKALAAKGYATVLACRNLEKGRAARDKIRSALLSLAAFSCGSVMSVQDSMAMRHRGAQKMQSMRIGKSCLAQK